MNPFTIKTFWKPEATDFYDKEISKVGCNYTCSAILLINFTLKKRRKLLSIIYECKHIEKEGK